MHALLCMYLPSAAVRNALPFTARTRVRESAIVSHVLFLIDFPFTANSTLPTEYFSFQCFV